MELIFIIAVALYLIFYVSKGRIDLILENNLMPIMPNSFAGLLLFIFGIPAILFMYFVTIIILPITILMGGMFYILEKIFIPMRIKCTSIFTKPKIKELKCLSWMYKPWE